MCSFSSSFFSQSGTPTAPTGLVESSRGRVLSRNDFGLQLLGQFRCTRGNRLGQISQRHGRRERAVQSTYVTHETGARRAHALVSPVGRVGRRGHVAHRSRRDSEATTRGIRQIGQNGRTKSLERSAKGVRQEQPANRKQQARGTDTIFVRMLHFIMPCHVTIIDPTVNTVRYNIQSR